MTAGRPTDYNPDVHSAIAENSARKGLTNTEIADILGVATSTFHLWRKEHVEFSDAVKRGKESADDEVEKSLYKRAVGEYVKETKTISTVDGEIRTEVTEKHVADTTAMIFWLKNRRPAEWRDKHDIEHSGTISWIDLVKNAGDKPD
jgi:transposase-like protein